MTEEKLLATMELNDEHNTKIMIYKAKKKFAVRKIGDNGYGERTIFSHQLNNGEAEAILRKIVGDIPEEQITLKEA